MQEFKQYIREFADVSFLDDETIDLFYKDFFSGLTKQKTPKMIVLAGSSGAEKTTYRKKHLAELTNYHIHDMDEILIRLPGYKEDLAKQGNIEASNLWWEKARIIADRLVQFAFNHKYNVIYDRTCGAEDSYLAIKDAKKNFNYTIDFYGFYVPINKAISRVKQRAKTEPRNVSEDLIHEYSAKLSALWPYYLEFVDSALLFDSNTDIDNKKTIYSSKSKEKVLDQKKYDEFLGLGNVITPNNNEHLFNYSLESIVKNFPENAHAKDAKTYKYILTNKGNLDVFDLKTEAEILGKTVFDLHKMIMSKEWPKDFAKNIHEHDMLVIKTKKPIKVPSKIFLSKTGLVVILSMLKIPIFNLAQEVAAIVTFSFDSTQTENIETIYLHYKNCYTLSEAAANQKFLEYIGFTAGDYDKITTREIECLIALVKSRSMKEAEQLLGGMSQSTLKSHINKLKSKTQILSTSAILRTFINKCPCRILI